MKMDEDRLHLVTVVVKEDTREALFDALRELGSNDADFIGENGPEYLWKRANGFSSNCEYVIDKIKDIAEDIDLVHAFIHEWMDDDEYYLAKDIDIIANGEGKIFFIVLAWVC